MNEGNGFRWPLEAEKDNEMDSPPRDSRKNQFYVNAIGFRLLAFITLGEYNCVVVSHQVW